MSDRKASQNPKIMIKWAQHVIGRKANILRKFLAGLLAAAMLAVPAAPAAASDITGNWAEQYITYLYEKGIMLPSGENFKPNAEISRAEFMRYLNRAFGFEEMSEISFSDVQKDAWYYDTVRIAVHYGYINGTGDGKMNPLGTLTREEAATIIGRLHKSEPEGSSALQFADKASISSWAASYINDAVEKKYIVGYPDNTFRPKGKITRSEIAKILYYYMGTRIDKAGVSGASELKADCDNVTITSPGATLSNVTVNGDLYITEGIGSGQVTLSGVTVKGSIIVSGGAVNLTDVTAEELISSSPVKGTLSIDTIGDTNIGHATVVSDTQISENDLNISAGGFSDITLNGSNEPELTLNGNLWNLSVPSPASLILPYGSTVSEADFQAKCTVTGDGSISKAAVKASGVSIETPPDKYEIASGISAIFAGKNVSGSTTSTVSPESGIYDRNGNTSIGSTSIEVSISSGTDSVNLVKADGSVIKESRDYVIRSGKYVFQSKFLNGLSVGNHTIEFVLDSGLKPVFLLTVVDSGKNSVVESQLEFDRYALSDGYKDVEITLNAALGNQLKRVLVSGSTLEEGTDYLYKNGVVILFKEYVAKRSKGVMNVTLDMVSGNDPQVSINIADTSPVNSVTPDTVKFENSALDDDTGDIKLTLRRVDGAKLEDIKFKGTYLVPVQDYYVIDEDISDGKDENMVENTLVLRPRGLRSLSLGDKDYAELELIMSKGKDPTIKVEYVQSYAAKFTVTDDSSQPIRGVSVTVGEETKTTDTDGIVKFSLQNGDYKARIINGDADPVEKTFTISGANRDIAVSFDVLYDVNITVTNEIGGKISGASVTLGKQTVTTGADGVASFKMKRGSYQMKAVCSGYRTSTATVSVLSEVEQRVILREN